MNYFRRNHLKNAKIIGKYTHNKSLSSALCFGAHGRSNNVSFITAESKYRVDSESSPGPGEYQESSQFGAHTLSHAGYYLVKEEGKLKRKKQLYFADNSNRLSLRSSSEGPGPGAYAVKEMKFNRIARQVPYETIGTPKQELQTLGPGSYDTENRCTKPRVKGIAEWSKSRETRLSTVSNSLVLFEPQAPQESMSVEPNIRYNYYKCQSAFASQVPRFGSATKSKKVGIGYQEVLLSKKSEDSGEMLGPGRYLPSEKLNTLGQRHEYSFGKNTRFSYKNNSDLIGPGTYSVNEKNIISEKYKQRRSPFFAQENPQIDLCLENDEEEPGPGKYSIIEGMSERIHKRIVSKKEALGGTSKRFEEGEEAEKVSPGPGDYNYTKPQAVRNTRGTAVFESRTLRNSLEEPLPVINQYAIEKFKAIGCKQQIEKGGGSNLFRFLKVAPGKKAVFLSCCPRFPFHRAVGPGPCTYTIKVQTTKNNTYINQAGKVLGLKSDKDRDHI